MPLNRQQKFSCYILSFFPVKLIPLLKQPNLGPSDLYIQFDVL